MKKITTLALLLIILSTSFGQDEDNSNKKEKKQLENPQDKPFQIGMAFTTGIGWYRAKQSNIEQKKLATTISFGLNLNYMFTKNVGISTGINFDWDRYHVNYLDTVFYRQDNSEILRKKDDNSTALGRLLTERTYKPFSIAIPIMLIFKTDLIGYFKYYGKFGMRTNIIVSQNANDNGFDYDNPLTTRLNTESTKLENIKTKNDLLWIRTAIGVSAGFEYFFTGSNALYAEISFFYGVTNIHSANQISGDDDKNKSLMNSDFEYFAPKSNLNQLVLKIGIMF